MPAGSTLVVFAAASLALLVIPGPAVLYIVARSSAQGARAGAVSVVGVHTGSLLHVLAAVVGLSAVVVASSLAFTGVKIVGGAYLIYLGVRTLLDTTAPSVSTPGPRSLRRLYLDGLVVNALNPKVALFFLAFLPQFISPGAGPVWAQTLVLGLLYTALGLASDGLYVLVAAGVGRRLRRRLDRRRGGRPLEGCLLIGLGVAALALPHGRPTTS
jgi:threonine/homoserine/homoserine lactone efflux protein